MLQNFIKYLLKNQVIFALFIIAFGWFIIQIRDILLTIFLSYIIMSAILPLVEYLRKNGAPKIISVIVPYFAVIVALILLIGSLIPFVVSQIESFAIHFPQYLDKSATLLGYKLDQKQIQNYLTFSVNLISQNAFGYTTKVFGGLFSMITIFIVSFYLLMYYENFKKFIAKLFHSHHHGYILRTIDRINDKLGAWLRGQLLLSLFIGVMSWLALTILGVPYAIPLGLLAGILEVVPTLGPTLSAVPAVIVALTISPTMAIIVIIIYVLIQSLEGHFLVPKIMQHSVGLNPVIVILGILIGTNLMGIGGALLAIPFISFILVIINSVDEFEDLQERTEK